VTVIPLPIDDVAAIIVENIKKRLSPVPIPKKAAYGWTDGLDIPRGGETILYTGLLYQLVPYINSLVRHLEDLERGKASLLKLGRLASKLIDITKIFSRVSWEEVEYQHDIIRSIAHILASNGVSFGYLYDDELYSGVLLYDLGLDNIFKEHIKKVYEKFRKYHVKNVITIDPHSTYILKKVYPEFIPDYDLRVKSYLEVLYERNPNPKNIFNGSVVIHDPCFYARHDKIIEPQRKLLEKAGLKVLEPRRTRELTYCCGGPIESISPRLSHEIARLRIEELKRKGENILVMCPLCYANLSRVADEKIKVLDISHYLYKAYG